MTDQKSDAIETRSLAKTYRLYNKPTDRLLEAVLPFLPVRHKEFSALSDINLRIPRGETVGIIGKNGSGKSTLLKLLTGVITPTAGSMTVNGTVSALLELGAGFNPDLSGMENIYLSGALMGLSREETESKIPGILSFADIGDFVNQPVRMYSSGMFARLAFAVAISSDPDVLIVDEALSVGDIFFQSKCYAYFKSQQAKGKTILFVTHSLDAVLRTCTFAICLDRGRIASIGEPFQVIDDFKKLSARGLNSTEESPFSRETAKSHRDHFERNPTADDYGSKEAEIIDYGLFTSAGKPISTFIQGDEVTVMVKIRCAKTIPNLIAAFAIKTAEGIDVLGNNTFITNADLSKLIAEGGGEIRFKFKALVQGGEYTLSLGLTRFDEEGQIYVFHRLYNIIGMTVLTKWGGTGICTPNVEVQID